MIYPILRESRVVVEDRGRVFSFNALSTYSTSIAYEEYKTTRRTIHRRTNYPHSNIVAQEVSAISLQINFTDLGSESILFDWLGLEKEAGVFVLPKVSSNIEPKMVTLYITTEGGESVQFDNCFLSSVDFTLDKQIPVLIAGFESGKFSETSSPPHPSILQGGVAPFYPGSALSNGRHLPGFISAAISLQQQCSWRDNRSIHDIGTIYSRKRAYVNELNSSAIVALYYIKGSAGVDELLPEYAPITITNNNIQVDFPLARITKRLEFAEVFRVEYDIIPTENSDPVTITLRRNRND